MLVDWGVGVETFLGADSLANRWHGTADTTLRYANCKWAFGNDGMGFMLLTTLAADQEALKEWSNVLNLSTMKTAANTPQSQYTQTIYGSGTATTAQLVAYSAAGVGHTVPVHEQMDIDFFGICS